MGVHDIKKSSFLIVHSCLLEFSVIRKASLVIDLQLGERFASVCQFLVQIELNCFVLKKRILFFVNNSSCFVMNSHFLWQSEGFWDARRLKASNHVCLFLTYSIKKQWFFFLPLIITTFAVSLMSHEVSH